jgi:hypothetical protein
MTKKDKLIDQSIEQAAGNLADPNICKTDNWIAGARWMADRMYSEDELRRAIEIYVNKINDESFEQLKKKKL